VKEWPTLNNVKELRQFLGFISYYKRLVKDFFFKIECPLNNLLKELENTPSKKTRQRKVTKKKSTTVPLRWTDTEENAFQTIKEKLISPPILRYVAYRKPFNLHTDASPNGLGAVLFQE
jgi:hypothetical protein